MIKPVSLICSFAILAAFTLSAPSFGETLQEAVQAAINTNPDVRFAATHRWTTEEQLKEKKADFFLPTLDLSAGYGYQNVNNPTVAAIGGAGPNRGLERGESQLSLDENLFAGFSSKNEMDRMKSTVNSAAYKTAGVSEDIALQATEKYLEVLRNQQFINLAQQNLSAHKTVLGMIGDRTEAGVSRGADEDQARGRYSLAESSLIVEKANLIDVETGYARVVGNMPGHLTLPVPPSNMQLPKTVDEAIAIALRDHPTLKSACADLDAAKAQHETSKSRFYPRVDLVLSAARNHDVDGLEGVNNDDRAMLQSSWNLFHGGADLAAKKAAAYQVQEAADSRNLTIWKIREQTRLSWNAWQEAQSQERYLEEHRDLVHKTLGAYGDQFKLGQRTLLDNLNAQNEYYQASVQYLNSKFTEEYARYRLMNAMGHLMDYIGVARPVEAAVVMPKGVTSPASLDRIS